MSSRIQENKTPLRIRKVVYCIGTPEVYFTQQPCGQQASTFAKEVLEGETVELELEAQKHDPYGRLLAYVYTPDGETFNEVLARKTVKVLSAHVEELGYLAVSFFAESESIGGILQ